MLLAVCFFMIFPKGESPEEAESWFLAVDGVIKKRVKDTISTILVKNPIFSMRGLSKGNLSRTNVAKDVFAAAATPPPPPLIEAPPTTPVTPSKSSTLPVSGSPSPSGLREPPTPPEQLARRSSQAEKMMAEEICDL